MTERETQSDRVISRSSIRPSNVLRVILASSISPKIRVSSTPPRSEEHTSELQSLMRISYAVFCLKKKKKNKIHKKHPSNPYIQMMQSSIKYQQLTPTSIQPKYNTQS